MWILYVIKRCIDDENTRKNIWRKICLKIIKMKDILKVLESKKI